MRSLEVLEARLHARKIHAVEVVKNLPDLSLVSSKAGMNVRFFPHSPIDSGFSHLLATYHVKCMYNQLQTNSFKRVVSLVICNQSTSQIALLDGVELLHMREGQTWLERR